MKNVLQIARVWLDTNIYPGAAFATLVVSVFFLVYLARKIFPTQWEKVASVVPVLDIDTTPIMVAVRKVWQTLPGTILAAVMGAISMGGSWKAAVFAAIAGPLASLAHEIAKAIPWLPYRGAIRQIKNALGVPPSSKGPSST